MKASDVQKMRHVGSTTFSRSSSSTLVFSYFSARAAVPASVADDQPVASAARRAELRIRRRNWDIHGRQQFQCRHTARIFGRRS